MGNFFYKNSDYILFQKAFRETSGEDVVVNLLSSDESLKKEEPVAPAKHIIRKDNRFNEKSSYDRFFGPRKSYNRNVDMSDFSSWKNKNFRETEKQIGEAEKDNFKFSFSDFMNERSSRKYNDDDENRDNNQKAIEELPSEDPKFKRFSLNDYMRRLEERTRVKNETRDNEDLIEQIGDYTQEVIPDSSQDENFDEDQSNVDVEGFVDDSSFKGDKFSVDTSEIDAMKERLEKLKSETAEINEMLDEDNEEDVEDDEFEILEDIDEDEDIEDVDESEENEEDAEDDLSQEDVEELDQEQKGEGVNTVFVGGIGEGAEEGEQTGIVGGAGGSGSGGAGGSGSGGTGGSGFGDGSSEKGEDQEGKGGSSGSGKGGSSGGGSGVGGTNGSGSGGAGGSGFGDASSSNRSAKNGEDNKSSTNHNGKHKEGNVVNIIKIEDGRDDKKDSNNKSSEEKSKNIIKLIDKNDAERKEIEEQIKHAEEEKFTAMKAYEGRLKELEKSIAVKDKEAQKRILLEKIKNDNKLSEVREEFKFREEEIRRLEKEAALKLKIGALLKKELKNNLSISNLEMNNKLLEITNILQQEKQKAKSRPGRKRKNKRKIDSDIIGSIDYED